MKAVCSAQVANFTKVSENLDSFTVVDRPLDFLSTQWPNVTCRQEEVTAIDIAARILTLAGELDSLPVLTRSKPLFSQTIRQFTTTSCALQLVLTQT